MSKNSKNTERSGQDRNSFNANTLRGLSVGQRIVAQGEANEIRQIVARFVESNPAYDYTVRSVKGTVTVERRVPENLYRRSLYVQSITKSNLVNTLRKNNWVKEHTADTFGVSARTIGRLINRHSLSAPRA